jgi:hypothetical protein
VKKLDLVPGQEHRAGEKMFVDYARATRVGYSSKR